MNANFHERGHPSRLSILERMDNTPVLLFVSVAVNDRNPVLANEDAFSSILSAWHQADNWLVGRYVLMPDHVHFFCAPGKWPIQDFHKWMQYWKTLASRAFWQTPTGRNALLQIERNAQNQTGRDALLRVHGRAEARPSLAPSSPVPSSPVHSSPVHFSRHPPLFQRDCWDTQLRSGDSYSAKWDYVRNNPVRKHLIELADDWPYQGECNILAWHDR